MLLRLIHTSPATNCDAFTYASRGDAIGIMQDIEGGYLTTDDLGEYRLADLVDIDAMHVLRAEGLVIAWQETIVHVFEIID